MKTNPTLPKAGKRPMRLLQQVVSWLAGITDESPEWVRAILGASLIIGAIKFFILLILIPIWLALKMAS